MSHSVHGKGRALVGEDVDQGSGIDEQASHNFINPNRARPQVTAANNVGSQAISMMPGDLHNPMYWQTLIAELM